MTLPEYIKNPMGKENAVFSQREMFRELYTDKFNKVMLREAGTLKARFFKDGDSRFTIHIKIPSEVIEKFYYDVVIQFTSKDPKDIISPNLDGYDAKFFSNDPAFVYTFAYAFNQNNLFIDDLAPKMSKQALTDKAKVRNPKNVIGYVKSIYFAYLYMHAHGFDKKAIYNGSGEPYDVQKLLSEIMPADEKIEMRQRMEANLEASKKKQKTVDKRALPTKPYNPNNIVRRTKTVSVVSSVKSAHRVSTSKYTKRK